MEVQNPPFIAKEPPYMTEKLQRVAAQFNLAAPAQHIAPYGNGHINDTYLVTTPVARYIMQRLNRRVFERPDRVMENIRRVTAHLAQKICESGGDPMRETLTVIKTRGDALFHVDEDGEYYRVYPFIERTVSFDLPDSAALFMCSAHSFGQFQRRLADFPAEQLHESIANFHNTPDRFRKFLIAVQKDRAGRRGNVPDEIAFALRYASEMPALIEANLPLRVTHNDTKLNNVLMDERTGEGLCVIDLDTVMPGLAAYDFGDAIRFGANTAVEDETDLAKVGCDLTMFEAYVRGYLRATGGALTESEIALLPMGAKLMTLECGLRFLTDHLNGDTYFKIHRENHNLDRARNQFALVRDMEAKWGAMQRIVEREAESI